MIAPQCAEPTSLFGGVCVRLPLGEETANAFDKSFKVVHLQPRRHQFDKPQKPQIAVAR